MAIAFDNSSGNVSGTGSITQSYTATGSNLYMLVAAFVDGSQTCSGITWNGTSLTQIASIADTSVQAGETAYIFGLGGAVSGTHNVVATFTGSSATVINIATYTGAQSTSASEASGTNSGNTGTATISITTLTDNDWLIGFARCATGNTISSAGTNTTLRQSGGGAAIMDSNAVQTPPGSFSLNANLASSGQWATLASALKPFSAASAISNTLHSRSLLGVGT